jgi:hypothetical protein
MKGPECTHILFVWRTGGAVRCGRHITAVTQYDADQQVRKVTVLFTAAANRLESMNWDLLVVYCKMLPLNKMCSLV